MTIALADVKDTDCLRSMRPLVLGRMPGKYVTGAAAIMRRILYAWLLPGGILVYDKSFGEGLLDIEGTTLAPPQLLGMRRRLEVAAGAEDFVLSAPATLELVGFELQAAARVTLVDGRSYPLEVSLSSAGAALRALGV